MRFNTAISKLMVFSREIARDAAIPRAGAEAFALLLAPFAPHLAEELWSRLGHDADLAHGPWPEADPALLVRETITLVAQVNGKRRDEIDRAGDLRAVVVTVRMKPNQFPPQIQFSTTIVEKG